MTSIKITLLHAMIMAVVLSAPLLIAENGIGARQLPRNTQAPASDRINGTQLSAQKAASSTGFKNARFSHKAPAGIITRHDIYKDSIILQHQGSHTVLPLDSVIYNPPSLANKMVDQPAGNFIPWPQFYLNNRNWIFTHEVSLKQAQGSAPLKPGIHTQFQRINRVVVAIHQNNPISVLSPSKATP